MNEMIARASAAQGQGFRSGSFGVCVRQMAGTGKTKLLTDACFDCCYPARQPMVFYA